MTGSNRGGVLVAQLGARRHYAVPRALHAAGMLERFMTDACATIAPWRWLDALVPPLARPHGVRRLLDRKVADLPPNLIHGFPWFALSNAVNKGSFARPIDRWARQNAAFGNLVVGAGFGRAKTVYGFNGAALEIFRAARKQGVRTVLDQTAAPWRSIGELLLEEVERWPGWEDMPAELDVSGQLTGREEQEWKLADRIVCGSSFVVTALAASGVEKGQCFVAPYPQCSHGHHGEPPKPTQVSEGRRFRVLFAGTLQLRKGIPYLLEAKRRLNAASVEFRLVGPSLLSNSIMAELAREMELVGPVARSEMSKHYDWADVLVLPTLSEGSSNVCREAMAAGLPVITTPNAGSVVRDGLEGYIVTARDPISIANRLERLATDSDLRAELSSNALDRISKFHLAGYARHLEEIVSFSPTTG